MRPGDVRDQLNFVADAPGTYYDAGHMTPTRSGR
jgi:hypothetical protein